MRTLLLILLFALPIFTQTIDDVKGKTKAFIDTETQASKEYIIGVLKHNKTGIESVEKEDAEFVIEYRVLREGRYPVLTAYYFKDEKKVVAWIGEGRQRTLPATEAAAGGLTRMFVKALRKK